MEVAKAVSAGKTVVLEVDAVFISSVARPSSPHSITYSRHTTLLHRLWRPSLPNARCRADFAFFSIGLFLKYSLRLWREEEVMKPNDYKK